MNDKALQQAAKLAAETEQQQKHHRALANELARVAQLTLGVANEHAERGGLPLRFLVATEAAKPQLGIVKPMH